MSAPNAGFELRFTAGTRFSEEPGTNPEELLGAAHAGCYSMALTAELNKAGCHPESVETEARVTIDRKGGGYEITRIHLQATVAINGIEDERFQRIAQATLTGCPVSKALAGGPEITLEARQVEAGGAEAGA